MTSRKRTDGIAFHSTGRMGVSRYEVTQRGTPVGSVQRYQMGAGQFGHSWMARTPAGHKRGGFRTRDLAAAWLAGQGAPSR